MLDESKLFGYGISSIIRFEDGIPIVCDMRIGDYGQFEFESTLQDKCTGDSTNDVPLEAYSAFVECDRDCEDTISSIEVRMPFSDWNENDIASMYRYFSGEFPYKERGASYSYDSEDQLESVNIHLSNSLYSIRIYDCLDHYCNRCLCVEMCRTRNESSMYFALNTLSMVKEDDADVWNAVFDMMPVHVSQK